MPASKTSNPQETKSSDEYRLPKTVVPSAYDLCLTPDAETFSFSGQVLIDVEVKEPVNQIRLNALELEIHECSIENGSGLSFDGQAKLIEKTEQALITFDRELSPGHWQLKIRFKGIHNDRLRGFYRSSWTDGEDKKHPVLATHFEPTDARRAFPCFDEPAFKATFKITLTVDASFEAISNGERVSEIIEGKKKTIQFAETMKMSSYLVAFVVGEFVSSEPVLANDTEIRIWSVPGKENLTGFAAESARFAVEWFEDYFEIPYPGGKKIDLLAIPDFPIGAMENLGCITFRESALLVDENTAAHVSLETVAAVVKHELSHMWFGDLVTMHWWNGLWLKESFATFMQTKCLDAWKPDWNAWDNFAQDRARASSVDALKTTHSIENPVNRPEEAMSMFDVISYEKGCSILYQIEQFIGEETFRKGIVDYLKKHGYGNTETHDLWVCLEDACRQANTDVPVRKIMDDWVFTPGHPLVSISLSEGGDILNLAQQDFKFLKEQERKTRPVPLLLHVYSGDEIKTIKHLLESERESIALDAADWIVGNAGGTGFYRVRYDRKLWEPLRTHIRSDLSSIERFNLANDYWDMVKAGHMTCPDYLDLIRQFSGESCPNVVAMIAASLKHLTRLVQGSERRRFEKFVRDLFEPTLKRLGWEAKKGDSVQTRQLRGLIIKSLGTIGASPEVQEEAGAYFACWEQRSPSVDGNVLPAVFSVLAHCGDSTLFERMLQLSRVAKTPQDSVRLLLSLSEFKDRSLLKKALDLTVGKEIRAQDAPNLFSAVMGNEHMSAESWQFFERNWQRMVDTYPPLGLVKMCQAVRWLELTDLQERVTDFFETNKIPAAEGAIAQALEQLEINIRLKDRESQRLAGYFS